MLTCEQLIDRLEHAVGKSPADGHALIDDLNQAGRQLFNEHDWSWSENVDAVITAIADQNFIELPEDFLSIGHAYIDGQSQGSFNRVEVCSLGDIVLLRETTLVEHGGGNFFMHFPTFKSGRGGDSTPRPRAQVAPVPTTTGDPAITIIYQKRWREMTVADAKALPNIDIDWERALISLACAIAIENENPELAHKSQLHRDIYDREIDRLKGVDSTRQQNLGPMRGGVGDRGEHESDMVPIREISL